jgi:hypothetical protein
MDAGFCSCLTDDQPWTVVVTVIGVKIMLVTSDNIVKVGAVRYGLLC